MDSYLSLCEPSAGVEFGYQRWKRAARGERRQAYDPYPAALALASEARRRRVPPHYRPGRGRAGARHTSVRNYGVVSSASESLTRRRGLWSNGADSPTRGDEFRWS